jgi:hypothetical protein
LKVKTTINPINQRFFQCAVHRALNQDQSEPLPPVDPVIDKQINPERETRKLFSKDLEEFKRTFTLKENEIKKPKSKLFWKDLIERELKKKINEVS